MSKIVDQITQVAAPIVREAGCELWDVEYIKEAGAWFLRVYIDREAGVSIDDCERVSRALDPKLDELDLIPGQYTFEVSSAGAERQLKRPQDFMRFMGHLVEVRLYRPAFGTKEHLGTLTAYTDGDVTLEVAGEPRQFVKNDIAMVKLRIA
ncbi:MAG: ribosome maturation factor RimP [Oscillospiraceae bacterium]|nr:ribosome maturation factor RimP [Oscillospiraceae bacterium]